MRFVSRATIAILMTISLAGCAIFGGPADRALRKTPSYREGYSDGCAAANNPSANPREDPVIDRTQYGTDKVYRQGWANGYQSCHPLQAAPGDHPYDPARGIMPGPQ